MYTYAERKQAKEEKKDKKDKKPDISKAPPQMREANETGIPDAMKAQFESVSGFSFDDVRVHYNSGKPAQLKALAFTQGEQVHIAPGQETHLPHELGHVVQQKEGRVRATGQINGIYLNNSPDLEAHADMLSRKSAIASNVRQAARESGGRHSDIVQRKLLVNGVEIDLDATPGQAFLLAPVDCAVNKPALDRLRDSPTIYSFINSGELNKYLAVKSSPNRFTTSFFNVTQGSAALLSEADVGVRRRLLNDLGPNKWNILSSLFKKKAYRPIFENYRINRLVPLSDTLFDDVKNDKTLGTVLNISDLWAALKALLTTIVTHNHADHNAGGELDVSGGLRGVGGTPGTLLTDFVEKPKTYPEPYGTDTNRTSLVTKKEYGNTLYLYPGDRPVDDLKTMVQGWPIEPLIPTVFPSDVPISGNTLIKNAANDEHITAGGGEICRITTENQYFKDGIAIRNKHVVIAASHHGSRTGTDVGFAKMFDRAASLTFVVSSGIGNMFRHPHREFDESIRESAVADKTVFNTQLLRDADGESPQGSIVVKTDGAQVARFAKIKGGKLKAGSKGMSHPVLFAGKNMGNLFMLNKYCPVHTMERLYKLGAPHKLMENEADMIGLVKSKLNIGMMRRPDGRNEQNVHLFYRNPVNDFFESANPIDTYMRLVEAMGRHYWGIYERIKTGTLDVYAADFQATIDAEASAKITGWLGGRTDVDFGAPEPGKVVVNLT